MWGELLGGRRRGYGKLLMKYQGLWLLLCVHMQKMRRWDGLVIFKDYYRVRDIANWLDKFQWGVDKTASNRHLQFTTDVQENYKNLPSATNQDKVRTHKDDKCLFLEMKMCWPLNEVTIQNVLQKGTAIEVHWKGQYLHTWYPTGFHILSSCTFSLIWDIKERGVKHILFEII